MYRFVKNSYLRNFVISFCLVSTIFVGLFKPKPAYAVVGVDDAIVLSGGAVVAPEIALALIGGVVAYGGYQVAKPYINDFENYALDKLKGYALDKVFSIKEDSSTGQKLATISDVGINAVKDSISSVQNDGLSVASAKPVSSPVGVTDKDGFNYYSYEPGNITENGNYPIVTIKMNEGDKIHIKLGQQYPGDTSVTYDNDYRSFIAPRDCIFSLTNKYKTINHSTIYLRYSLDNGATWYTIDYNYKYYIGRSRLYYSWEFLNTSSYTVKNVITAPTVPVNETIASTSAIAVPISGQYDEDTKQTTYKAIDGATAKVYDNINTDSSTKTDIDANSGVSSIPILGDILNVIRNIWDKISSLASDVIDGFKGWLESIIDLLKSILSAITGFLEKLLSGLKDLFIPKTAEIINQWNDYVDNVKTSLKVPSQIASMKTDGIKPPLLFTFTLFGINLVIDLRFIDTPKFLDLIHMLTAGLSLFLLAWYNYKKVYSIIRGVSPSEGNMGTGGNSPGFSVLPGNMLSGGSDIPRLGGK